MRLLMDGGVAIDMALQDYKNKWIAQGSFAIEEIEEIKEKSKELPAATKAGQKQVAAMFVLLKL